MSENKPATNDPVSEKWTAPFFLRLNLDVRPPLEINHYFLAL